MDFMRTRFRLSSSSPAPPPSPIPTGKGSRSAADSIFTEYVDRSKQIPELALPEYVHHSAVADIDYPSLLSRDSDCVNWLLKSAAEFGLFLISGHGISAQELRSTFTEAELIFGVSTEYCRHYDDREEFVWCRSGGTMTEQAKKIIEAEKYGSFSQKMENVASKLESIAEELGRVISGSLKKQPRRKIQPGESTLSLYRYNHATLELQNHHLSKEIIQESRRYALSLHLLVEQGEFSVQSGGPLSFNTSPETIVVTIGEQLEEWSLGELKSAYGRLNIGPNLRGNQASFSFELKCSPSILYHDPSNISKRISVADQILIVLVIAFVYKIFVFTFPGTLM